MGGTGRDGVMSYQRERDQFIARMTREGLDLGIVLALLRAATTLQRYAELACSSKAVDRDRVDCPASPVHRYHVRIKGTAILEPRERPRKVSGPCLCDDYPAGLHAEGKHGDVTRIAVQGDRLSRRLAAGMPAGWELDEQGDPRGYVLRVIPPRYQERNQGRDRFNRDSIGVPARESGLRF